MADQPLRSAKDLWLGEPLLHQLPNLTQAHLLADLAFIPISGYLEGRFLRVTHPFATRFMRVRLACIKPLASTHSGPGSYPYLIPFFLPILLVPKGV